MKSSIFVKTLLLIAGIIGIAIGASLLFSPVAFEASAGINLGDDLNLLSEIRAPGAALLAAGVLIIIGAYKQSFQYTSLVLLLLFYLSYGVSRIYSIAIDGLPSQSLVIACLIEVLIGFLGLIAFRKVKHQMLP